MTKGHVDPLRHLQVETFTCQYAQPADDPRSPPQALGKSVSQQCTEFLQRNDAWPVASALDIPPLSKSEDKQWSIMTHVMTVAWVPRRAWEAMQSRIVANAMEIMKQREQDYEECYDDKFDAGAAGPAAG